MFLAIDVGNTNVTIGLYDGDTLESHWRLATDHQRMADEYGIMLLNLLQHAGHTAAEVHAIAMASVVPPLTGTFVQACETYLRRAPLVVDAGVKTGVRVKYDDPKQVGADRVVDAAAVQKLYGGPACVVDFGTATTFDAISADGEYLGGAIAPGMVTSLESLTRSAAQLFQVELVRPPKAIGKNTVTTMQSGVVLGFAGLVEGLVKRLKSELGDAKVIATGGLAEVIAPATDVIDVVDLQLTLKGLKLIYELNQ